MARLIFLEILLCSEVIPTSN